MVNVEDVVDVVVVVDVVWCCVDWVGLKLYLCV